MEDIKRFTKPLIILILLIMSVVFYMLLIEYIKQNSGSIGLNKIEITLPSNVDEIIELNLSNSENMTHYVESEAQIHYNQEVYPVQVRYIDEYYFDYFTYSTESTLNQVSLHIAKNTAIINKQLAYILAESLNLKGEKVMVDNHYYVISDVIENDSTIATLYIPIEESLNYKPPFVHKYVISPQNSTNYFVDVLYLDSLKSRISANNGVNITDLRLMNQDLLNHKHLIKNIFTFLMIFTGISFILYNLKKLFKDFKQQYKEKYFYELCINDYFIILRRYLSTFIVFIITTYYLGQLLNSKSSIDIWTFEHFKLMVTNKIYLLTSLLLIFIHILVILYCALISKFMLASSK